MDGLPIYWMDGLCHYPPNLSDRSMIRYHYLSMTLDGWMDHGRSILNKTTAIDGIHPSIAVVLLDGWMDGWSPSIAVVLFSILRPCSIHPSNVMDR